LLTRVTQLEKLGRFRLRVRFSDGGAGVGDFAAMVNEPGPMLDPLRDPTFFERVFLEFGALTWPNGFDIDPEALRLEWLMRVCYRRPCRASYEAGRLPATPQPIPIGCEAPSRPARRCAISRGLRLASCKRPKHSRSDVLSRSARLKGS